MNPWPSEALWIVGTLLAGTLLGALAGSVAWGVAAGLGILVLRNYRQLHVFQRWLDASLRPPAGLHGVLEEQAFRIRRLRRGERVRSKRLARILRQLQGATNALPDATVLLDDADDIVWFNEAGRQLLHLERRDLGTSLAHLLRSPALRALLDGRHDGESLEFVSPLDDSVMLDVRVIPYADGQRLVMARDVTQLTRLRQMRQDFIANVSHELRTPLTVMIGYLEALDDDGDGETVRATLKRLRRPAARMKTLVEDLLLLSRLDTSPLPEESALSEVDVAALLRRVCADIETLGSEEHTFELAVTDGLFLRGVDAELHSAFSNLIVNAVRYSPAGGVVRIGWSPIGDGARFSVSDQGLGIAEEHIPRLTERFYRIDVGRSRDAGGTGLGLAIVKHVLRRHGSELQIHSRLGKGSEFSCDFDAERLSTERGAQRHEAATLA